MSRANLITCGEKFASARRVLPKERALQSVAIVSVPLYLNVRIIVSEYFTFHTFES